MKSHPRSTYFAICMCSVRCGKVLKEEDDCLKAFYRRGLAYSKAQEFDKAKVICHLLRKISKVCSNTMPTMLRRRKSWQTSKWPSSSRTKKRRNFLGIFFPRGNSMMMWRFKKSSRKWRRSIARARMKRSRKTKSLRKLRKNLLRRSLWKFQWLSHKMGRKRPSDDDRSPILLKLFSIKWREQHK